MGAPKGNRFWEARARHGRSKIFSSPEQLWSAACEYFQWVEDNPLKKAIVYQGEVTGHEDLLRAMTISGICIFWGVNKDYLTDFSDSLDLSTSQGKDFSRVIKNIYEIIKTQKFEGASAGLLNPNIIARDLGLVDKQTVETKDVTKDVSDKDLDDRIKALMGKK